MRAMQGQRVAKKEGGGKLPWLITGSVVGILAAAYLGLCAWAGGRQEILPNVSISGVNVSNMTVEQAQSAVETAVSQQGKDVTLALHYMTDQEFSEELNGADVQVDAAQSAQNAWQEGRGNFLTGGPQLLGHMLGMSSQVPAVIPEDDPALQDLMERMEQAVTATDDQGYTIEEDRLVMVKGAPVVTVDWEEARTQAEENLLAGYEQRFSGQTESSMQKVELTGQTSEVAEPDFEAIHRAVYTEPKDAALDLESMEITGHTVGVDFDVQALRSAYQAAKGGETFSIPLTLTQPKVTKEDLGGSLFRDVLGEATTTVTGTTARRANVKLAASRCNDTIVLPGEEFSYNKTAGGFSAKNGYLPAPIYVGGRSEDGIGGGVCQGSSTIYYAVLHSTLEIVERHDHRFAVTYMPAGMDATVYGDTLDFRFRNSTDYPIKVSVVTYTSGGSLKLTAKIYGTNIDGRYGDPTSTVYDVVNPTTVYQPDASVARGTLVLDREQNAYTGKKAHTYRTIREADGTVVEKQDMGTSSYSMRPHTYYYNPADGDPTTWVNGKPPAASTEPTDPGTTTPTNPGATTPADPGTETPGGPGTTEPEDTGTTEPEDTGTTEPSGTEDPGPEQPEPSDSGLNFIDPNAVAA